MISVKFFDSIKKTDKADWNSVTENDHLLSFEYLEHVESTLTEGIEYHYIIVYENGIPVVVAPLFLMRLDIAILLKEGWLKNSIMTLRKVVKRIFTVKTLFVGSPPSTGNFGATISPKCKDSNAAVEAMMENVGKFARKMKMKMVLYKEMTEPFYNKYQDIFKKHDYCFGYDMPNNLLELQWENDTDYLGAMRSKSRQAIIRSSEKLQKNGIRSKIVLDISQNYKDREYRMYLDVLSRSDNIFETLTLEYFSGFGAIEKTHPCLISIYSKEEIVGYFLTCDISPDTVSALFAGIDYRYNHDYDIYFNLFHNVIIYAMERKKKYVSFGQNTYEVKQRYGCNTEELYIAFLYRNKLIHRLLSRLSYILLPRTQIAKRRVFK